MTFAQFVASIHDHSDPDSVTDFWIASWFDDNGVIITFQNKDNTFTDVGIHVADVNDWVTEWMTA